MCQMSDNQSPLPLSNKHIKQQSILYNRYFVLILDGVNKSTVYKIYVQKIS